MDDSGKDVIGDDGLNGVELGPAVQLTPGWKPADRLAVYTGGSGTDTVSFIYVVQEVSYSATKNVFEECQIGSSLINVVLGGVSTSVARGCDQPNTSGHDAAQAHFILERIG